MSASVFQKSEMARDLNDNHVAEHSDRSSDKEADERFGKVQLVVPAPKRFRPSQPVHVAEARSPGPKEEKVASQSPVTSPVTTAIPQVPWQLPLYHGLPHFPFPQYSGFPSYPFPVLPEHVHPNLYKTEYFKYFPNPLMYHSLHFPPMAAYYGKPEDPDVDRNKEHLKENECTIRTMAKDELKISREDASHVTRMATVFLDKDSVVDLKKKDEHVDHIKYQCDACNKSYSTFSGLTKHKQFHCAQESKKEFTCKYCEKTYVSLGALKMHIRTHTLPCKCKICGKSFSRPWLLQGHVRTHTGEKPFTCVHCLRAFADRSNLRAHLQTHSDVKKYSCRSCSKTFSRMSLLLKHEDMCRSSAY